jgi:hypothetical protein
VSNIANDALAKSTLGTVLQNILVSYDRFKCSFTKAGNNFLKVPIYCNNAFGFGRGNINKLDENFFEVGNDLGKRKILMDITWEKLLNNGNIKTQR